MKTPGILKLTDATHSLKSSLKALTRVLVLAGTLLLPNFSVQPARAATPEPKSVRDRASLVRATLKQKVAGGQVKASDFSFAERSLVQWGNWGNWGNWNNWLNWNNWNNWKNWANWGNWANI
jgi:hypothetical protein